MTDEACRVFNKKVAELLKDSSPEEIVSILNDELSTMAVKPTNNNNNNNSKIDVE